MAKKYYRFFGGLLTAQERWLNKMAGKGYRLIRTEKLLYEFEDCAPGQVQYRVEFIGGKSKGSAARYHDFLEDMGYRVFYKNINLNYSVGKVRLHPWAEKGGRIATNSTTFNRELLLVEKTGDGKPFDLHTTYEDRQEYCRSLRSPYLFFFAASAILGIFMKNYVWGFFALLSLIPLALYQAELMRLKKLARSKEW